MALSCLTHLGCYFGLYRNKDENIIVLKGAQGISECFLRIVLPVVVYGYQTEYLTLRDEHRVKVRTTGILDVVHRPGVRELNSTFRKMNLFPSSGDGEEDA
jgi:hypothetical protein